MKLNHLLRYLMLFVAGTFMFSCSSSKHYEYAKTGGGYHKSYVYTDTEKATEAETKDQTETEVIAPQVIEASNSEMSSVLLERKSNWQPNSTPEVQEEKIHVETLENTTVTETKTAPIYTAPAFKAEKKQEKKGIFAKIGQKINNVKADLLEIVFAFLLPPVAVYLHNGVDTHFWISVILTVLLVTFPLAIIHALLVITDNLR